MYVSRKKKTALRPNDSEDYIFTQSVPEKAEDILREELPSETELASETLEIGRDLILEPEDEEWVSGENDAEQGSSEDPAGGVDVTVPDDPQELDDGELEEDGLSYEEFVLLNTDQGVLRVQTSAGGQSIPLQNVRITVYRDLADGRHIFYTQTTDPNGVADGMVLPAPPRINSIEGNGSSPFASYSVSAAREGLRPATVENVPIFAGVKSIQPLTLAPAEGEV